MLLSIHNNEFNNINTEDHLFSSFNNISSNSDAIESTQKVQLKSFNSNYPELNSKYEYIFDKIILIIDFYKVTTMNLSN
jgi:hypothetical protein